MHCRRCRNRRNRRRRSIRPDAVRGLRTALKNGAAAEAGTTEQLMVDICNALGMALPGWAHASIEAPRDGRVPVVAAGLAFRCWATQKARLSVGPLLCKMSACDRGYCRLPSYPVVLPSVVTVAVCYAVFAFADLARLVVWTGDTGPAG